MILRRGLPLFYMMTCITVPFIARAESLPVVHWLSNGHGYEDTVSTTTVPFKTPGQEGTALFLRHHVDQGTCCWGGDVRLKYNDGRRIDILDAWQFKSPKIGLINLGPNHEDLLYQYCYGGNGETCATGLINLGRGELIRLEMSPVGPAKADPSIPLEQTVTGHYNDPYYRPERDYLDQWFAEGGPLGEPKKIKPRRK